MDRTMNLMFAKGEDVTSIDPLSVRITNKYGKVLFNIKAIQVFKDKFTCHYLIDYTNGESRRYEQNQLKFEFSCLGDEKSGNCFKYFKRIAENTKLYYDKKDKDNKDNNNQDEDNKTNKERKAILAETYKKIEFVGEYSALALYFNPDKYKPATYSKCNPIFPFGGNLSQFQAVRNALANQISVIQGPPGTGKTQTILNIISNLLIQGKNVQVVSNNNSAIDNVLQKMSSSEYNLGFLVALLGKNSNKNAFIENQTAKYPDMSTWKLDNKETIREKINENEMLLSDIFKKQQDIAKLKQELKDTKLELRYFDDYCNKTGNTGYKENFKHFHHPISSERLMRLWQKLDDITQRGKRFSLFAKLQSIFIIGMENWKICNNDISKVIICLQKFFYQAKILELTNQISAIESKLKSVDSTVKIEELTELSLKYLHGSLFDKYGKSPIRRKFEINDLFSKYRDFIDEYPVILSTTFSSRNSLNKDMVYDYVIMDEASQADVVTGALALSNARNAVIVGDVKQLTNIVDDNMVEKANEIAESFNIDSAYSYTDNNFLESICKVLPTAPQTLLREHYRCHPKIIGFCNNKFYNNELIIMTQDKDEKDIMSVYETAQGKLADKNANDRQAEIISSEVLKKLSGYDAGSIGIIAPYNNQIKAIKDKVSPKYKNIEVATVHKFQGREKDIIILSTVDDVVNDFSDGPELINVAVSRAKKRFVLIVSGNKQPAGSNVSDLIAYIKYNNMQIIYSKIYSVFDFLFTEYTLSRLAFLKKHKRVSEYDSENLMFGTITDVVSKHKNTIMNVFIHYPLYLLIRDTSFLSPEEFKYAMNPNTHLDFLISKKIGNAPILAIEVDGISYHKKDTVQYQRDKMKNHILETYGIPYLRFPTNGSMEKQKLEAALKNY